MSANIKISKEDFLKLGTGRKKIDYEAVKQWMVAQGDYAIPVKSIEEKFNIRFNTLVWRGKQEGDKIITHTVKQGNKSQKMCILEVGVSQPKTKNKSAHQ